LNSTHTSQEGVRRKNGKREWKINEEGKESRKENGRQKK
jgi:hypothetical protein